MAHRNARLTVHGRRLLVRRVRVEGMPVAHVAKAMGISRQCAPRWVARWDAEGDGGVTSDQLPARPWQGLATAPGSADMCGLFEEANQDRIDAVWELVVR